MKRVIESSTKIKLVWAEQFEDVYYRTISLDKLFSRSVHLIRNITQYENSVSLVGNYRFYWAFPFHTRIDNLETHLEITKTDDSEMKISLREMRYFLGDDAKNESKRCQLLDALLGGGDYTSDFPRISTFVPIRKLTQIEPKMKEMLAMESCQMVREYVLNQVPTQKYMKKTLIIIIFYQLALKIWLRKRLEI